MEDALLAAKAGADAIGLVFDPTAPRYVAPVRAAEILSTLPPFVTPVGLFVDLEPGKIRETARSLGLRHIQLHGCEPPEVLAELRDFTIIKAVRVHPQSFGGEMESWRKAVAKFRLPHLQGIVLETRGARGGSGKPNDWETVRRHRQRGDLIGLPHLIAAGGLTPDSVGAVVRDLRPWAVDVSSGVESAPGRKSAEKIEAFMQSVRDVERE